MTPENKREHDMQARLDEAKGRTAQEELAGIIKNVKHTTVFMEGHPEAVDKVYQRPEDIASAILAAMRCDEEKLMKIIADWWEGEKKGKTLGDLAHAISQAIREIIRFGGEG